MANEFPLGWENMDPQELEAGGFYEAAKKRNLLLIKQASDKQKAAAMGSPQMRPYPDAGVSLPALSPAPEWDLVSKVVPPEAMPSRKKYVETVRAIGGEPAIFEGMGKPSAMAAVSGAPARERKVAEVGPSPLEAMIQARTAGAAGPGGAVVIQPGKMPLETIAREEPTPGVEPWAESRKAALQGLLGEDRPAMVSGAPPTTISGEIAAGPPEAVPGFKHEPGLINKLRDETLSNIGRQKAISEDLIKNQTSIIDRISTDKDVLAIRKKMDIARSEVEQARKDLQDFKVKPWWGKDAGSVISYILSAVGAAAGAFASGFSHGKVPNLAGQIFMSRVKQDAQNQKARFQKLMKIHGLSVKERAYLETQWKDYENKKNTAILRKAQLQLGVMALEAKETDTKRAAIDTIIGIKQKLADIELKRAAGMKPPAKITTKEQAVMPKIVSLKGAKGAGKTAGMAPAGPLDRRNFIASLNGLKQMDMLIKSYKENKPWDIPLISRIGPATQRFRADRTRAMMQYVKAMSGVQFSAKELEMHKDAWARGFGAKEWGQKEAMYKMNQLKKDIHDRIVSQLRMYPDLANVAIRSKHKSEIEQAIKGAGGIKLGPTGTGAGVKPAPVKKKVSSIAPVAVGAYSSFVDKHKGNIDPRVVNARIMVESGGRPDATAKAQRWKTGVGSEIGLLQMSPDTRKQYKVSEAQAKDPETNIRVQMKQWNAWANSFFGGKPPKDSRVFNTWAWLTTAVGPGAVRRLRALNKNDYSIAKLASLANNSKLLAENRKFWGSQSPGKISQRIKSAIGKVNAAMR